MEQSTSRWIALTRWLDTRGSWFYPLLGLAMSGASVILYNNAPIPWILLAKGILTIGLIAMAWADLRTGWIPMWLTHPALVVTAASVLLQLGQGNLTPLMLWALIFTLWLLGLTGGGDAKVAMIALGLFPEWRFFVFLFVGKSVLVLPLLVRKYVSVIWGNELLHVDRERQNIALSSPGGIGCETATLQNIPVDAMRLTWTYTIVISLWLWLFI